MRTCTLVHVAVVAVLFASSNPTISATTSVSHAQSKVTEVSSPALRVGDTNQKEQDNEERESGWHGYRHVGP
ncbi:hypothetical protein PI125_g23282 [Phytophthora idaei]|nr:hypothetical protein PI125_g23282 [Phytophthora idaei]KAG3128631.1 hypothetical protein PI126_g21320 [Phytophthora idaei]